MLVLVDEVQPLFQGAGFRTWIIGMPFSITTPPIDLPDVTASHIAGLGDPTSDPLGFVPEIRPLLENLDLISFDTLSLPNHIPEVKGRAAMSPDDPLDLLGKGCNFVLCESHDHYILKSGDKLTLSSFTPLPRAVAPSPSCNEGSAFLTSSAIPCLIGGFPDWHG